MKKKITEEEVREFISKLIDKVNEEMDYTLNFVHSQMSLAENDLVDSLDEKQRALYDVYRKRREEFYDMARQMYVKKQQRKNKGKKAPNGAFFMDFIFNVPYKVCRFQVLIFQREFR